MSRKDDDRYRFLFPYEKIPKGANILIYGAGMVGQEYMRQIFLTGYCNVVAFIDQEWKSFKADIVPVYGKELIPELEYDYIVLAFKIYFTMTLRIKSIIDDLLSLGVEQKKIIYVSLRETNQFCFQRKKSLSGAFDNEPQKYAFAKQGIAVAMRIPNVLGDNIIYKKFFEAIIGISSNIHVDIYTRMSAQDVKALYYGEKNLNLIVNDTYDLYNVNMKSYMCAISFAVMVSVDFIEDNLLKYEDKNFYEKIISLREWCREYGTYVKLPLYVHYQRQIFQGNDAYRAYNCGGIFHIVDNVVRMPLDMRKNAAFKNLALDKYITVHYGAGMGGASSYLSAKQWPYERFCKVVSLIKESFPNIEVIQLGEKTARKIKGVDRCLFGEPIELVKHILKHSMLHFDIDSGLVHLATQLETKCVVLFGQSFLPYYAYSQNINIVSGKCHPCSALYEDGHLCARGMEKPECMYSITVDMVMEKINAYLGQVYQKTFDAL